MFKLNPLTLKKINRFRSIKRGYYSFIIIAFLILFSIFAELFINNRALLVKYNGDYYFPTYGKVFSGKTFGEDYEYEVNYRILKKKFVSQNNGNYVIMPVVPYNAFENDFLSDNTYPPYPPNWKHQHYLGTDTTGRDVLARLIYGFRIAISFAILLLLGTYVIGVSVGCAMGYWGGKFDLFFQRHNRNLGKYSIPIYYNYCVLHNVSKLLDTYWNYDVF